VTFLIIQATPSGRPVTMPAKMISEMPLPMPRSEICSPSHMMKAVPVVRVRMVSNLNPSPGFRTMGWLAEMLVCSRKKAVASDWKTLSTMVRYRVYWVIFLRPSSPSFDRRSRYGQTMVSSWRMMEAVM